ncbi:MAG: flagellar hook assembly protein FlgD [Terriglobales bacterium]
MTIVPSVTAPSTPNPTAPTTAANSNDSISESQFMNLLTAELKDQDPTNPMDPTQFVGQLTQFQSLEELININQDLTPPSSSGNTAAVGTQQ